MTPEDTQKLERWTRRMAAREAEYDDVTGGRVVYLARRFPIPNTDGMSPAEAEATLAEWRAEVNEFIAAAEGQPATPNAVPPMAQSVPAPGAPVA